MKKDMDLKVIKKAILITGIILIISVICCILYNSKKEKDSYLNNNYEYYDLLLNYLNSEAENVFSPYYELLNCDIKKYDENIVNDNVECLINYTITVKNFDKDPDTVGYIKEAKEKGDPNYEIYYREYQEPRDINVEIKAVIDEKNNISLYMDRDPATGREWTDFHMEDLIMD